MRERESQKEGGREGEKESLIEKGEMIEREREREGEKERLTERKRKRERDIYIYIYIYIYILGVIKSIKT